MSQSGQSVAAAAAAGSVKRARKHRREEEDTVGETSIDSYSFYHLNRCKTGRQCGER